MLKSSMLAESRMLAESPAESRSHHNHTGFSLGPSKNSSAT
jgi:hypothetical protein